MFWERGLRMALGGGLRATDLIEKERKRDVAWFFDFVYW